MERRSFRCFVVISASRLPARASARYTTWVNALPPGSRATLLNTYRFAAYPFETLRDMRDRYGDPFFTQTLNGRLVVTSEPELIRELFGNRDPELFAVFATEAMEAFFGTRSVLTQFGEPHKQERKLLTPPFHGERMRAYGSVMVESTRRAFAGIGAGQPFIAIERTTEVSLEAIVRAVFGIEERELVERTQRALRSTLDAAKPVFLFSKATQVAPFGLGPWATYLRALGRGRPIAVRADRARRARARPAARTSSR